MVVIPEDEVTPELDAGTDDDACDEGEELTGLDFVEEAILEAVDVALLECDFELSVDDAEEVGVELLAMPDDPMGVGALVIVWVEVLKLVSLDLRRSLEV